MESTTITTTQISQGAYSFGLSEGRATITLQASAHECGISNSSSHQSKNKVLKRQRSSSPELLRCKRRLSFNGLGYTIPQQQPVAVARRNERERNRVKQVNMGFQTLRQHVPNGAANKKMSKVETLRSAVEYIRALQQLLDEHDAVIASLQLLLGRRELRAPEFRGTGAVGFHHLVRQILSVAGAKLKLERKSAGVLLVAVATLREKRITGVPCASLNNLGVGVGGGQPVRPVPPDKASRDKEMPPKTVEGML
ncbi:hypothetical protein SKAU_G00305050 [Synaphobranchus kaupii]|uniref:BHLH domain-containing protein n=1 Tax=Synaphobranchus kaupii TaxID=118154 RepID=A0A9Q1EQI9_SYNKA|nr:hypothetical protein SKAU_G00305050 [Synaphobranchus kaupii]